MATAWLALLCSSAGALPPISHGDAQPSLWQGGAHELPGGAEDHQGPRDRVAELEDSDEDSSHVGCALGIAGPDHTVAHSEDHGAPKPCQQREPATPPPRA